MPYVYKEQLIISLQNIYVGMLVLLYGMKTYFIEQTYFSSHWGLYQYNKMPFEARYEPGVIQV